MEPKDRQILREFSDRVHALEPRARMWAFGSRARGNPHPESDFDFCIVLPEPADRLMRSIREAAWELGLEHERVLSPVIISEDNFENGPMSASSLVATVRREGVAA